MLQWLLGLNIIVPIVAAVLCFLIKNHAVRAAVVLVTAADLIITSIMLLLQGLNGPIVMEVQTLFGVPIGEIILVCEFALLLVILYISYRLRNALVALLTLIQLAAAVYLDFFLAHGAETMTSFYIDELSLVLNLLVSIVGSLICVFAIPYMKEHEHHLHLAKTKQPRFFFLLMLFLGAMNGLCLTNNITWLYFFWEVTTFCSFALIGHDGTEIAIKNAQRAILLNMTGGVAFIFGIIIMYQLEHTFSIQEIIAGGTPAAIVMLPLGLLCVAGFTKSAQMPFQSWLLGAMVAPTPVSALLHSATMVKAGVYLIVRLAPAFADTPLSLFVALFGTFTFLMTSALAISQSNGKKILAYSTIANLGLIIACAGINSPLAIAGAIMIMIFHGVSKGMLFLCVGTIEHGIGSRDLEDMHGLVSKMPMTTIIAVIGMVTMLLPPFGMFLGKWSALEAASTMPYVAVLMCVGSALTLVFWLRWAGIVLAGAYDEKVELKVEEQSPLIRIPLVFLALSAVVLSFLIMVIFDYLMVPYISAYYPQGIAQSATYANYVAGTSVFPVWAVYVVLIVGGIVGAFYAGRAKSAKVSPVYMCGENVTDSVASLTFMTAMDKTDETRTGLYYVEDACGEAKLTKPCNILAILIIIAMFGVIFI